MSDTEVTAKLYLELANLLPLDVKSSRELGLIRSFVNFVKEAKEVRDAQKQFFKTRDNMQLRHSKLLEGKLDEKIDHILSGAEHPWSGYSP